MGRELQKVLLGKKKLERSMDHFIQRQKPINDWEDPKKRLYNR